MTNQTVTGTVRRMMRASVCAAFLAGPAAVAQGAKKPPTTGHMGMKPAAPATDLQHQLDSLRQQIADLKALLEKSISQSPSGAAGGGMAAGGSKMSMDHGEMGKAPAGMAGGGMGMMDMMDKMPKDSMKTMEKMDKMPKDSMRMSEMMGRMPKDSASAPGMAMGSAATSPAAMPMPSALPGNPGASHLYHIGATGFFLDQASIELTTDQRTALNQIRERALAARSATDRKIEQIEEEIWLLTAAGAPDAAQVSAKVREASTLRTDGRVAFIAAVGEASQVLTAAQRAKLLGATPPAP